MCECANLFESLLSVHANLCLMLETGSNMRKLKQTFSKSKKVQVVNKIHNGEQLVSNTADKLREYNPVTSGLLTLCTLMDSSFWFDTINLG